MRKRRWRSGATTQCNQRSIWLESRAIEFTLLPWQRERGIQTMAYAPLAQGALAHHPLLQRIARERAVSAAQIALGVDRARTEVIAIQSRYSRSASSRICRRRSWQLGAAELAALDEAFPAPRVKQPLATT